MMDVQPALSRAKEKYMNCQNSFSVFKIFLGDEKTLSLRALYAGSYLPLDLTDCTEIIINLPNADGSIAQLKLSTSQVVITSPPVLGQYSALITTEVSELLNIGELQSIFVSFTINGDTMTVSYPNSLSVFQA